MYRLEFTEEEKRQIASSILVEVLLHDGYFVVGRPDSEDFIQKPLQAMLVPPEEAPGSRWYDPGPQYPEQYVKAVDLLSSQTREELEKWKDWVLQEGVKYLMENIPWEVEIDTIRKETKVISRDGVKVND